MEADAIWGTTVGRSAREGLRVVASLAAAWSEDRCSRKAAALAYYTVFSLAPVLVIVLAVAGSFVDAVILREAIVEQARLLVGDAGATLLGNLLEATRDTTRGGIAAAIALMVLLVGATSAFAELKDGLDELFCGARVVPEGLWATVRARLLSFGMVLVLAFLLLVSLAVNAALATLSTTVLGLDPESGVALRVLSWVATLVVVTGLFAAIYKLLPETDLAWRDAIAGASLTALFFLVGRFAIGLYLGNSAPASAFGAAGSLAVLLLWVYYSASIFYFGAEVTRLYIAPRADRHQHPPIGHA